MVHAKPAVEQQTYVPPVKVANAIISFPEQYISIEAIQPLFTRFFDQQVCITHNLYICKTIIKDKLTAEEHQKLVDKYVTKVVLN